MANGEPYKMVITVNVGTGRIEKVEKVVATKPEPVEVGSQRPLNPTGGYKYIGTLLAYTGSNCVTLNLPGGGSYEICQP
jgi:hypothetical protein